MTDPKQDPRYKEAHAWIARDGLPEEAEAYVVPLLTFIDELTEEQAYYRNRYLEYRNIYGAMKAMYEPMEARIHELREERDSAYHRGYNAAIEDAEAISDVLSDSVDLTLDMTEDEVRAYRRGLRWFVRSIADLRHQVGTEREETTDADT
jgi:hypothetical protein